MNDFTSRTLHLLLFFFLSSLPSYAQVSESCPGCTGTLTPGTLVCGEDDYGISVALTNDECDTSKAAKDPSGACKVDQGSCVQQSPCKFKLMYTYDIPDGEEVTLKYCFRQTKPVYSEWACVDIQLTGGAEPLTSCENPGDHDCGDSSQARLKIGDCSLKYDLECTQCLEME